MARNVDYEEMALRVPRTFGRHCTLNLAIEHHLQSNCPLIKAKFAFLDQTKSALLFPGHKVYNRYLVFAFAFNAMHCFAANLPLNILR